MNSKTKMAETLATPPATTETAAPTALILDAVNDLSSFCHTDDSRYVLTGIHLAPGYVEATNGSMLARAPYPEGCRKPEAGFILPGKEVKAAIAGLKKAKLSKAVVVEKNCTTAKLSDDAVSRTAGLVEADWPNTDQVWPGAEPKFSIHLSAKHLATLCTYASKIHAKGQAFVRFDFTDSTEVVKWSADSDDGRKVTGLLMPARMT